MNQVSKRRFQKLCFPLVPVVWNIEGIRQLRTPQRMKQLLQCPPACFSIIFFHCLKSCKYILLVGRLEFLFLNGSQLGWSPFVQEQSFFFFVADEECTMMDPIIVAMRRDKQFLSPFHRPSRNPHLKVLHRKGDNLDMLSQSRLCVLVSQRLPHVVAPWLHR
jgi:hypothetical protein